MSTNERDADYPIYGLWAFSNPISGVARVRDRHGYLPAE